MAFVPFGAEKFTPEQLEAIREKREKALHSPEAIAKAKATRARKQSMMKEAQYILSAELDTEDEIYDELVAIGSENPTYQSAMLFNIIKKAIRNADVEAARFIRDTSGQKPADSVQFGNMDDKPLDINLSQYSDEELRIMIAARLEEEP